MVPECLSQALYPRLERMGVEELQRWCHVFGFFFCGLVSLQAEGQEAPLLQVLLWLLWIVLGWGVPVIHKLNFIREHFHMLSSPLIEQLSLLKGKNSKKTYRV